MLKCRDGVRWEPTGPVYAKAIFKSELPPSLLITPDRDDPPEMEFYRGVGFSYHDRCFMMMLNYAPSPLMPGVHGPTRGSARCRSRRRPGASLSTPRCRRRNVRSPTSRRT